VTPLQVRDSDTGPEIAIEDVLFGSVGGTGGGCSASPGTGGAATILASGQMGANGIAVDATSVYWTASTDRTVIKVAE
jgi:hypothetical protein